MKIFESLKHKYGLLHPFYKSTLISAIPGEVMGVIFQLFFLQSLFGRIYILGLMIFLIAFPLWLGHAVGIKFNDKAE